MMKMRVGMNSAYGGDDLSHSSSLVFRDNLSEDPFLRTLPCHEWHV